MMKPLPIKRKLNEDTRLGEVHMGGRLVLSLYSDPEDEAVFYLAAHGDPETIYMMVDRDFWNEIFERGGEDGAAKVDEPKDRHQHARLQNDYRRSARQQP
jgi:hypothetical protein